VLYHTTHLAVCSPGGGGGGGVSGTAVGLNSKNLGALKAIDAATMTTAAERSRRRPMRYAVNGAQTAMYRSVEMKRRQSVSQSVSVTAAAVRVAD